LKSEKKPVFLHTRFLTTIQKLLIKSAHYWPTVYQMRRAQYRSHLWLQSSDCQCCTPTCSCLQSQSYSNYLSLNQTGCWSKLSSYWCCYLKLNPVSDQNWSKNLVKCWTNRMRCQSSLRLFVASLNLVIGRLQRKPCSILRQASFKVTTRTYSTWDLRHSKKLLKTTLLNLNSSNHYLENYSTLKTSIYNKELWPCPKWLSRARHCQHLPVIWCPESPQQPKTSNHRFLTQLSMHAQRMTTSYCRKVMMKAKVSIGSSQK
jgi:hypothetical protein